MATPTSSGRRGRLHASPSSSDFSAAWSFSLIQSRRSVRLGTEDGLRYSAKLARSIRRNRLQRQIDGDYHLSRNYLVLKPATSIFPTVAEHTMRISDKCYGVGISGELGTGSQSLLIICQNTLTF